jgi:hypothetical protein
MAAEQQTAEPHGDEERLLDEQWKSLSLAKQAMPSCFL